MKNILLVDDERSFLLSLKDGLMASGSGFNVLLAGNGREALQTLKTQPIDLLVTDLKLPEIDGFQILAHVSRHYPYLPVIVMTAFGTPEIEERLARMNALHYLEKPLEFDVLAQTIESSLSTGARSYIRGITLATFLQLIRMEQKTCSLKIRSGGKAGYLFLRQGELLDAQTTERQGERAALEIIAWEEAEIEMDSVCRRSRRVISTPLEHLLMEAFRLKDETARDQDEAGRHEAGSSARPGREHFPETRPKAIEGPATGPALERAPAQEPDQILLAVLRVSKAIQAFAIFDDVGFLEHQSDLAGPMAQLDPGSVISLARQAGARMDWNGFRYLVFATEGRVRYMFFERSGRQVVLSLAKGAKPEQLLDELSPSLFSTR